MVTNEDLIERFYSAFQAKDFAEMQACYSEGACFSDPVFPNLDAPQVRSMWEMFCKNGKDLTIEFEILGSSENSVDARWKAKYTFSATGNKVINVVQAHFIIEDGHIIEHIDRFDFYNWAKQALGYTGLLLGWTSYLRNTVRKQGAKALNKFMKNRDK